MDKVTRPCPQITTFEEKGEPKRYRSEVLPLTSLAARPNRLSHHYHYHRLWTRLVSMLTGRSARTAALSSELSVQAVRSTSNYYFELFTQ